MVKIPKKDPGVMYTDQQWQAIYDGGDNLLISASAGSGKTRVLVDRIIEKIKQGASLDNLLVVTFTNAAAAEMKERIEDSLKKLVNHSRQDAGSQRRLVKEINKIPQADISTLHAFCLKVIRRFYYIIDLDPVFRLATDETEISLMKEEVWEELREAYYAKGDEEFLNLVDMYGGQDDQNLTDLVLRLYDYSRAHPQPDYWLDSLAHLYQLESNDLSQTSLYQDYVKPDLLLGLFESQKMLQIAYDMAYSEREEGPKQYEILEGEKAFYENLYELVDGDQLDQAFNLAQHFNFTRWSTAGSKETKEFRDEMKLWRDQAKKNFEGVKDQYLAFSPQDQVQFIQSMEAPIEKLGEISQEFSEAFQAYKLDRQILDFNDLEHYTLEILNTEQNGIFEAQAYYTEKYSEILTDEYQDTSRLQEAILDKISQKDPHGNRFMVGDVKQSIYSFRQAEPSLFVEKYTDYAQEKDGRRIVLAENFRSRKEVLDFTNLLFIQLMDASFGGIEYDKAAELVAGNKNFPDSNDFQVELLIYEKEADEEEDDELASTGLQTVGRIRGEAQIIGQKILELVGSGFEIYDKEAKQNRPIKYSDIVVLSETRKHNLDIQSVFQELNIPVGASDTQNYFRTSEVEWLISLLKVIDNPHQDIPYVAVLRSPIVGLDENDLALVRLENPESDFYTAGQTFLKNHEEGILESPRHDKVYRALKAFEDQLASWRQEARRQSIASLIWDIYRQTGILDYVGGMPSGKQRQANLHALYERASAYEEMQFKGLFQFIRLIERIQESDKDLKEPTTIEADQDAIRMMTIHGAKGLEFPVVFIINLNKNLNLRDSQGDYVLDSRLGMGTKYFNPEDKLKMPTLPESIIKDQTKINILAEKMRLLYVALTRAEQKLFLVGSYKNKDKALEKWSPAMTTDETVLSKQGRLGASSLMDWIGMALIRHPNSQQDQFPDSQNQTIRKHPAQFKLEFKNDQELNEELANISQVNQTTWLEDFQSGKLKIQSNQKISSQVQEALDLMQEDYPFMQEVHTTSYQSVSEIKRIFEDPDQKRLLQLDISQAPAQNRYVLEELDSPAFIGKEKQVGPAEIGIGTHYLFQRLDLSSRPTEGELKDLLEKIVEEGNMEREVAKEIRLEKVLAFFETDFYQRMQDQVESLEREVPFSMSLKAKDLFTGIESNDPILIHGIIDGFFEEEGELVLFDYKTDQIQRFGDQRFSEMLKKYRGQLSLYQLALENALNKPVKDAYLVLLDTNEVLSIH